MSIQQENIKKLVERRAVAKLLQCDGACRQAARQRRNPARLSSEYDLRLADEAADEGGGWDVLVGDWQEAVQELQESCRFGVFGAVLRDCREDSFGF